MNQTINIKIDPKTCIKILKLINGSKTQNFTFVHLKNKLKLSSKKTESYLLFLEQENYIEKRIYMNQKKGKESIGYTDYALDTNGINFFNNKKIIKFPSKYKLKFKISITTAKDILKIIKNQNKKGVYPKKDSALITIYQTTQNTNFSDFSNYILFLQKEKKIKIKRYVGPNTGYEDILLL